MAEKYELAALDYVGGMKYKDIAEKYEVSIDTVKSWKKRHWQDLKKGAPKTLKSVHTKKESARVQVEVTDAVESPLKEPGELTDKQWLFCMYYVQCFNATKAYQQAYGCAYTTAMTNGNQLLRNTKIKLTIEELKSHRYDDEHFNKFDVLQKYKDIAFSDIGMYVEYGTEEVEMIDEEGLPLVDENDNIRTYPRSYVRFKDGATLDNSIVSEVKQGKDGISVKLHDKMKALDVLAKYTDLLDERTKSNLQNEKVKVELVRAEMNKQQQTDEHTLKLEQARLNIEKMQIDIENARGNTDKQIEIIVRPKAKRGSDET